MAELRRVWGELGRTRGKRRVRRVGRPITLRLLPALASLAPESTARSAAPATSERYSTLAGAEVVRGA